MPSGHGQGERELGWGAQRPAAVLCPLSEKSHGAFPHQSKRPESTWDVTGLRRERPGSPGTCSPRPSSGRLSTFLPQGQGAYRSGSGFLSSKMRVKATLLSQTHGKPWCSNGHRHGWQETWHERSFPTRGGAARVSTLVPAHGLLDHG